jgi:hypothetical protein
MKPTPPATTLIAKAAPRPDGEAKAAPEPTPKAAK